MADNILITYIRVSKVLDEAKESIKITSPRTFCNLHKYDYVVQASSIHFVSLTSTTDLKIIEVTYYHYDSGKSYITTPLTAQLREDS
jgi:hypothetical protein